MPPWRGTLSPSPPRCSLIAGQTLVEVLLTVLSSGSTGPQRSRRSGRAADGHQRRRLQCLRGFSIAGKVGFSRMRGRPQEAFFHLPQGTSWMGSRHPIWTVADYRRFAAERGGKLLGGGASSRVPAGAKERLAFKCSRGHRWTARASSIKYDGPWCQKCIGISQRAGIEEMHDIAAARGGSVVSEEYIDAKTKLLWRCRLGHEFWAKPNDIKSGQWCPHCHAPRGERITRAIFESLFGKAFPKQRPRWLRSARGTQLELDGYCEELGVAFEHQGNQHYSTKYLSSGHDLPAIQKRDRRKRLLCRKNGIKLLAVPDLSDRLRVENAKDYIVRLCARLGIAIDKRRINADVDLSEAYSSDHDSEELELLRSIAADRGGHLVSRKYLGSGVLHTWECDKGHRWKAVPRNVKHLANWCPFCAGRRQGIEDMRRVAAGRGGGCLSSVYRTSRHKLRWRCGDCSHEWAATPFGVITGRSWCPECAKKRIGEKNRLNAADRTRKMTATKKAGSLDLRFMRRVAKERKGECLAGGYRGANVKEAWRCGECSFEWLATPNKVCRKGTWCPKCSAKKGGKKRKDRTSDGLRPAQVRARRTLKRITEASAGR